MGHRELPAPPHYAPEKVGEVWRVAYQVRAAEAEKWAQKHAIAPADQDSCKISLLLVDVQNTFCVPGFELYVAGRSGTAAVDDNRRLVEFIYRNLDVITDIRPTLDTHTAVQIFHGIFLVDKFGRHPEPFTLVTEADIENEVWQFNPKLARSLGITPEQARRHLRHYTRQLKDGNKYDYTIWPYHAMLGGIGHAMVSSIEEAVFFHSLARCRPTDFHIKGDNPFTENYSVLNPEVRQDGSGKNLVSKDDPFIARLLDFDALVIAGQAKSHCVLWTIDDLLDEIKAVDDKLTQKVYILDDCTSAIVVPDVVDYTESTEAAFQRFAAAGMHIVRSTDPLDHWPGMCHGQ
jgi:nicotinamidase-related amidase